MTMAQQNKENKSNYFSHDSNARNSDKLIRLRMRWKAAGYGVYFMILERLREEPNYMSVKDYNMIAFDLREDASMIKSVVEDFGLFVFTDDGKYFYSESFNRRMAVKDEKARKQSEAGRKAMQRRWGKARTADAPNEPISSGKPAELVTSRSSRAIRAIARQLPAQATAISERAARGGDCSPPRIFFKDEFMAQGSPAAPQARAFPPRRRAPWQAPSL